MVASESGDAAQRYAAYVYAHDYAAVNSFSIYSKLQPNHRTSHILTNKSSNPQISSSVHNSLVDRGLLDSVLCFLHSTSLYDTYRNETVIKQTLIIYPTYSKCRYHILISVWFRSRLWHFFREVGMAISYKY